MILWMILLALLLHGFGLGPVAIVFWVAIAAALAGTRRRPGGDRAPGAGSGPARTDTTYRAYRARRDRMDRWERRYQRERQSPFSRHRD
ncbi:hypothetical protein ABR738_12600 [Streptomyces sp. Edi4]|uniref:hypothetical protein n=1 Tax=Streptomyces sp. Edi4 TaxID=3162527 RepID=UPI0033068D95